MFFEVKKYIPEKHIFNIMNFFKENKVNFNFNTFKSSKILKLNIYNTSLFKSSSIDDSQEKTLVFSGAPQNSETILKGDNHVILGGYDNSKKIEIDMKNTKYKTKIYEYDDGYSKTINFYKINSIFNNKKNDFNEDDFCGVMIFDDKNNEATIQSINSYDTQDILSYDKISGAHHNFTTSKIIGCDCIKCFENKSYKIGEILFRIMICICVFKKIKKINLIDNSYLNCGNDNIPLIYLRTITKGKPYYSRYGFYPINHNKDGENDYYENELQIYRDNVDTFNTNPTIKKNKLIKILNYQKFDEIKDKKMIDYLNNIIMPYINSFKSDDISIKDFVSFMIEDKKKIPCSLLANIIMTLFNKCGYKQYKYKHFEFVIEKKFAEQIQKHIKIKNLI